MKRAKNFSSKIWRQLTSGSGTTSLITRTRRNDLNSADVIRYCESLIEFLLDHGADINYGDQVGESPLHHAAGSQNPTVARIMLAKGAFVNKLDNFGIPPLHIAASRGNISVVELLLDNGADIYSTDTLFGYTPFTRATVRYDDRSYDVIKLLLERKGKCDKTISYASQALRFALYNCDLRTIKLLLNYETVKCENNPEMFTKLHNAVINIRVDVIQYFLDYGIDVNARSKTNLTPLHNAADYGRSEACKLLLSRGANVNYIDDRGYTPLYSAIHSCNYRIIKICPVGGHLYLNVIRKPNNNEVRNILIAHIAKLLFLNIWINEKDLEVIEHDYEMKCYYKNCIEELKKMKIRKVYENVSLFNILMKNGMASGYARNEDLIEALDSAENELNYDFPIYYSLLKENFYKELKKQRLLKVAAIFLNEIFNFHDPLHLANLKILSYLREQDIIRISETK